MAGKQSVDPADNIAHLPVFPLQHPLFPGGPEYQADHIEDKQPNQHGLQTDAHHIFRLYHLLGDVFREGLHQDIPALRQVADTDIIRLAVRSAEEGAVRPRIIKYFLNRPGRLRVDDPFRPQLFQHLALADVAA